MPVQFNAELVVIAASKDRYEANPHVSGTVGEDITAAHPVCPWPGALILPVVMFSIIVTPSIAILAAWKRT